MFTLHEALARERMLAAQRVAQQYRLAAGLPRSAAGAGRSRWRPWRTHATPVPPPNPPRRPLLTATSGQSARRLDQPIDMSQPEVFSS
jgi:hypothetical protein